MDNIIKKVLDDLYAVDGSLRQHEEKLIKIINELIESRPDTRYSEDFARELRQQVLSRARALSNASFKSSQIKFMNSKNFYFALGGAVLAALIFIPMFSLFYAHPEIVKNIRQDKLDFDFNQKIAKLESNAFGSLTAGADSKNSTVERGSSAVDQQAGLPAPQAAMDIDGLSRNINKEEALETTAGYGGGGAMGEAMIMPGPTFAGYKHVYAGEEIPDIASELPVYRRIKDKSAGMGANLGKYDSSLLDMGSFSNVELTNFNISEDREFGYSIYFNIKEGMVSINSNWERWPQPYAKCHATDCYEQLRLRERDIPTDEEIIAIADKFLAAYGINMTNFGPAHIMDSWRLERAVSSAIGPEQKYYIPDTIQAVYPLKINNQEVFDQGGGPSGLSVEVNIRYKKVAGLYNLQTQGFEQSKYRAVTDKDRLVKLAEQGGFNSVYYFGGDTGQERAGLEEIKIGTPIIGLMRYWKNDSSKNRTEELFVPALIFPLINKPQGAYYYQNNIVIPIIEEVLNERGSSPPYAPMPMMRSDVEPSNTVDADMVEAPLPVFMEGTKDQDNVDENN